MVKKLYKSRVDVKIDGVCAGVAQYLSIDVTLVRIIWIIAALSGGVGVWAYLACALLMPREPFIDANISNSN